MTKTPSLGSAGGLLVFALGVVGIVFILSQTSHGRRIMGVNKGMISEGG